MGIVKTVIWVPGGALILLSNLSIAREKKNSDWGYLVVCFSN